MNIKDYQAKRVKDISNIHKTVLLPIKMLSIIGALPKEQRHIIEVYLAAMYNTNDCLETTCIFISTSFADKYQRVVFDVQTIKVSVSKLSELMYVNSECSLFKKCEITDDGWIILGISENISRDIFSCDVIEYYLEDSIELQHNAYCIFTKCLINNWSQSDPVELSDNDIYNVLRMDKETSLKEINAMIEVCIEDIDTLTDLTINHWKPYTGRQLYTPYYMTYYNKYNCSNIFNLSIDNYLKLEDKFINEFDPYRDGTFDKINAIIKCCGYTFDEASFVCFMSDIAELSLEQTIKIIYYTKDYDNIINVIYYYHL